VPRKEPVTELDRRFSSEDANPTAWEDVRRELERAQVYWLSTVRADGRPHVTPLIALWLDDLLYFTTGPTEQKAKNIAQNQHCVVTTGANAIDRGLDVVVEGDAVRVTDDRELGRVAEAYETKYGSDWHFDVKDGAFHHEAGEAWVFAVAPVKAFGFAKGEPFGQTRFRFAG
jgi:nitroimidazol reductase NimA-like FMN-containing flavoprotein (pyridoxamine 5'-phosphate oxidase superfamily)